MKTELTFTEKVHQVVNKIPKGKVTTYGAIAIAIGKPQSARFVGYAMGKCPEDYPWHRVVNSKGGLIPSWADLQRKMLVDEKVPFLKNGNVDLKNCFWTENIF